MQRLHLELFIVISLVGACAAEKKPATVPTAVSARAGSPSEAAETAPAAVAETAPAASAAAERFGPVYFGYDDALLSDSGQAELQRVGEYLEAHPDVRVVVSGNTDERGTDEYNVALGEERARVCGDYLQRLGVDSSRLRELSYGEARPAVAQSNESAWARNRRVELELSR